MSQSQPRITVAANSVAATMLWAGNSWRKKINLIPLPDLTLEISEKQLYKNADWISARANEERSTVVVLGCTLPAVPSSYIRAAELIARKGATKGVLVFHDCAEDSGTARKFLYVREKGLIKVVEKEWTKSEFFLHAVAVYAVWL